MIDFVLVFKIIIKLVAVFFFLVEFFKYIKIIFNSYFWKPLPFKGRLDRQPCLVCSKLKIFRHMHEREVVWVIQLILIIFSIGITIDILFVYSYVFYIYYMVQTSNSINFDWYLYFHTYIYDLIVITISYILKYKLCLY